MRTALRSWNTRSPQDYGHRSTSVGQEDEIFHLIDGELRFQTENEVFAASAGDVICLPRATLHGFKVTSPDGGRALSIKRGGFEDMLRAAFRPADHDEMSDDLPPTPEMQAALAQVCAANGIDLAGPSIACPSAATAAGMAAHQSRLGLSQRSAVARSTPRRSA